MSEKQTFTEYEKGFLEGLQAACIIGNAKWKHHLENAQDKSLSEEDQEGALNCVMATGQFIADIKLLGSQVHRKTIDPRVIVHEHKSYWWATEDGVGRN